MTESPSTVAEASVVAMIGATYSGEPAPAPAPTAEFEVEKFEFDLDFQAKIAAFVLRDDEFMRRSGHLVKPAYFENDGVACVVNLAIRFHQKYKSCPDMKSGVLALKDDIAAGIVRRDLIPTVSDAYEMLFKEPLTNREFVEEKLVEFVRHQAVGQAILQSVDLLGKKKFTQIEAAVKAAIEIGINEDGEEYDYFAENENRAQERLDKVAGVRPPAGITTGILKMDELLYHRGWGRKELTSIMGGAKAGKSTALINFARAANLKGHNVLCVTLEVSARIYGERLDACITDTEVKALEAHINDVKAKVEAAAKRAGKFKIHEYPSGTFKPSMLRRLLDRYKSKGISFDLVVVDYADIMAPEYRTDNAIENSKSVYIDLRAIAQEYNVAMLTATQTNRDGHKAAVAKAEHVSEDFNKVRTVDLMISINRTEEEVRNNEARLYFAASRNQEAGFTIFIRQNMARMKFVESVIRVE